MTETEQGVQLPDPIEEERYLGSLRENGRKEQTVRAYGRGIDAFRAFLDGENVTEKTLSDWAESMTQEGLSAGTVNQRLSGVNGLLGFCGKRGIATPRAAEDGTREKPLARRDFLRVLEKAAETGNEQAYFLAEALGCLDITIGELPFLTAEACRKGKAELPDRVIRVPECLGFSGYAARRGIASGPVFATRSGKPIDRSNATHALESLGREAGVEGFCPRALRRMYRDTQEALLLQVRPTVEAMYESMLRMERDVQGWP